MLGNPTLERKLLEQTYDGVMTVAGTLKWVEDGETVIEHDAVLYEDISCGLSHTGTPEMVQDGTSGEIRYTAVLFCAPELDIPPGCRITVRQYGTKAEYQYSGESAVLPTHQQLSVKRVGRV